MTEYLAWLVVLPLAASLLYLGAELLLGLAEPRPLCDLDGPSPHIVLLVPAHDEAAGIAGTVAALRASAPGADILVVADNCSDRTAARARAAGAAVIERTEPEHRGKGFALAFGRDHLTNNPPDAVIVVDADCRLGEGSARRLAARAVAAQRPVQAANLLTAEPPVPTLVAVSNFAMLVKNLVRARGLMRLGGGVPLFGTGMAFPWPLFAVLPLATGEAVEDLELGLWLARQGIAVELDDGARVTSPAASVASSRAQRSRWEHGFLRTAAREGLPLLVGGIASGSRLRTMLGAHLLVPPLALLMLLVLLGLAAAATVGVLAGVWPPFLLLAAAFVFVAAMLLAAWWIYARDALPIGTLLRAPLYIIWKIPIYLRFFTRRQTEWNRTQREGEDD